MFTQLNRLVFNAWLLTTLISLLTFTIVQAASGDLDTTFDSDGWAVTQFPGRDGMVQGIAIQSNGKIIVAGESRVQSTDNADFGVARYNPNGSPDLKFSGDGKVATNFGQDERARGVALQSDNKIVVAGQLCNDFSNCNVALARYTIAGKLDLTFSADGKVVTNYGGANNENGAYAVAIQPDGKIVVAGYAWNGTDYDFAVYRYTPNGRLDKTFAGDGVAVGNFGAAKDDFAQDLVIQGDGKIIVVGSTGRGSNHNFAIARLKADGTADLSFHQDGRQVTNFGGDEYAYGVALQPNGKIVVVGEKYDLDLDQQLFAIARYNANGNLDITFNGTGKGKKVISIIAGADSVAADVLVQPNGKIVVLGTVTFGSFPNFALVRLNTNGSFDSNFSGNGIARFPIGSGGDFASAIALQPSDGKYLVGGGSWVTDRLEFVLVRVLP